MVIVMNTKKYLTVQELEAEDKKYLTDKKIFLFDLDHTLYCVTNKICSKMDELFYDIIREHEGDIDVYKYGKVLMKKWKVCLFRSILWEYKMKEDDLKKIISKLEFKLFLKESRELKEMLKKLDGIKYVFTNAFVDYAEECMKNLNLENEFERIVCADFFKEFHYQKPFDTVFEVFEKHFPNTKRENFVFFDDLEENIATAKKRGWTTCLITYENNTLSYLKKFIE